MEKSNSFTVPVNGRGSRRHRGFTFIELMLVTVIIGILAGLSVPRIKNTLESFQLNDFASRWASLTRFLQASALATGRSYHMAIDAANGEFRAGYMEKGTLKPVQGFFSRPLTLPKGMTLRVEKDKRSVLFFPDGTVEPVKISISDSHDRQVEMEIRGMAGDIKIH